MRTERDTAMRSVRDFGAIGDGMTDDSKSFQRVTGYLGSRGGGTLLVPDGAFVISRTVELPSRVSLQMTPGATIKASARFDGEAVVQTVTADEPYEDQRILGGTIDGSGLNVIGLRVHHACRALIGDLLVKNALRKGIHIGVGKGYEVNVRNVWCRVEAGVKASAGSIGLHYDSFGDSLVTGVVIIGYETCLRSDSYSNDFHLVHVWNHQDNCPLVTCFYCNGWNDSYSQCYADSPINGDQPGYGFYVARPNTRIMGCRVFCNSYATAERVTGVFIADGATGGCYVGNHFMANEGHEMRMAFDGNLEGAYIAGNSYAPTVKGGKV